MTKYPSKAIPPTYLCLSIVIMKSSDTTGAFKDQPALSPPLAPPYNSYADTVREQLVSRPLNTPNYIYRLYTLCQEIDQPPAIPQLVRSYVSNELAAHDGLCWLWDMQQKQGADYFGYYDDEAYNKSTGGRCYKFTSSKASKWKNIFSVWVAEEFLY